MSDDINEMKALTMRLNDIALERLKILDELWKLDKITMDLRREQTVLVEKMVVKYELETKRRK